VRDGRTGRELHPDRAGNPERTGLDPVRSCRTPEDRMKTACKSDRSSKTTNQAVVGVLVIRSGVNRHEYRERNVHRSNVPSPRPQPGEYSDFSGRLCTPPSGRIIPAVLGCRIPENNKTNRSNKGDSVRRITSVCIGAWGTCRATRKS